MNVETLSRWDVRVPRYTSYPPADRFDSGFGPDDYAAALRRVRSEAPLSLYVHLPFCPERCTYCACTMVVTQRREKMDKYLGRLSKEIDRVAAGLGKRRRVVQLHLGGGTPNAYGVEDLAQLVELLGARFDFDPEAELAIEIDPRLASAEVVSLLGQVGFNRLSMGVQDVDPIVQAAIGRVQTIDQTRDCVDGARDAGFDSVSVDLVYGLPHQSPKSFAHTLGEIVRLAPDRIALFGFAYLPRSRPHHRDIEAAALPDAEGRMELFCMARERLMDAGWLAIGMDHFARPDDRLGAALEAGTLRRNFQGYTVLDAEDVVGLGASSIGFVGGAFCQNARKLADWGQAVDAGRLATVRGLKLSEDDQLRRRLIEEVMCRFEVAEARAGTAPGAVERLRELEPKGLVRFEGGVIRATELGQVLVRLLASCFDPILAPGRAPDPLPYAPVI